MSVAFFCVLHAVCVTGNYRITGKTSVSLSGVVKAGYVDFREAFVLP